MVNRSDETDAARQSLSALMDGQSSPGEVEQACAAWRVDAEARRCWHSYHLIGDVLRSEDLATRPTGDAAFLQALRTRLADEPVPLAPAPLPVRGGGRLRGRLMAPVAAAAGFVAVAGVLVVTRVAAPEAPAAGSGATLAQGSAAELSVANGKLVRDARLDRYLSAHRQVANGAVALMPGGVVRSVDAVVLEDK